MAQYIASKNQTLLWQTIQKHSFITQVFSPESEQNKINWFKNIISEIYNSNSSISLNKQQLIELNKETLRRMIDDMRQAIQSSQLNQITPYSLDSDRSYSRESILQDKTTVFQKDLEKRQTDYEELFQKPTPIKIDFEKTNDQVIHNMDELIARQLRERENDLQQISRTLPKPSSMNEPINIDTTNIFPKHNTLIINQIMDDNITIDVIDVLKYPNQKKQVSWDMSEALELKIDELSKKYVDLLDFLEKKIPDFQKEFSHYESENSIKTG